MAVYSINSGREVSEAQITRLVTKGRGRFQNPAIADAADVLTQWDDSGFEGGVIVLGYDSKSDVIQHYRSGVHPSGVLLAMEVWKMDVI